MEFNNMRECFRNNEEGKFLILVDTPIDDENDETSIIYLGEQFFWKGGMKKVFKQITTTSFGNSTCQSFKKLDANFFFKI